MKLLSKIKAFFRFRGQDAELDVSAVETKNGRVYLHPEEDKSKVYCIRSSAVEIYISPRESISEDDVEILDTVSFHSSHSPGEACSPLGTRKHTQVV